MDADGGMSKFPSNKAGAKYGTGYCDSQCPQDIKFINGEANVEGWGGADANTGAGRYGTCCAEMDLWEANVVSTAYTPHPCKVSGQTRCDGVDCGAGDDRYSGVCDKDGCDLNSYRMGHQTFYGSGMEVDTSKPITVITQFITDDNTDSGTLVRINRFYAQGGKVIPNADVEVDGIDKVNHISEDFCKQQKTVFGDNNHFATVGGLAKMGESMKNMVLVLSIWDDQ
jgi:cellulose 1,4-beta-cellobiosidase